MASDKTTTIKRRKSNPLPAFITVGTTAGLATAVLTGGDLQDLARRCGLPVPTIEQAEGTAARLRGMLCLHAMLYRQGIEKGPWRHIRETNAWATALAANARALVAAVGGDADNLVRFNHVPGELFMRAGEEASAAAYQRMQESLEVIGITLPPGGSGMQPAIKVVAMTVAALEALAELAEHPARHEAKAHRKDEAKAWLFRELRHAYEDMHGKRFTVTNPIDSCEDAKASGAAMDWTTALLRLVADRAGEAWPELGDLAAWAQAKPDGLAERIRDLRGNSRSELRRKTS